MSVGLYLKARNSRILPLRVSAALPNWELRLAVEMLSSGSAAAEGIPGTTERCHLERRSAYR